MRSGPELSNIRKIQILGHEHSAFVKRCAKDQSIFLAGKRLAADGMNIVTPLHKELRKFFGQIFVQFHLHEMAGNSGIGKSS